MSYLIGPDPIVPEWRGVSFRTMRARTKRSPVSIGGPVPEGNAEPLAEILESAILPRLLAAHGLAPKVGNPTHGVSELDFEALVPLALDTEVDALLDHVDALLREGISVETLFVDLLAPAARYLGTMWEDDRCDFIDVTMGLWRLQEVVHELSGRLPPDHRSDSSSRRALFASMPGEQHSFGTVLIDETFRRDGWRTDALFDPTRADLLEHVARDWFDVVGLTVSRDCNIEPLPHLIRALKSVSRNPRMVMMVGGRVFMENPSLSIAVGADGTAADAVQAVAVASSLVHAIVCEERTAG